MKKITLSLIFVFAGMLNATQYQDKATDYTQESKILVNKYYSQKNIIIESPVFSKKQNKNFEFTTYNEMISFVEDISKNNKWANLKYFGKSQENKKIPYLYLSNNNNAKNKIRVWLQGGIHGNEPAGAEGMLALLVKMQKNQKQTNIWLENMDIIIVPRFNIDGTDYFQRRSARNIDFNRDHVKLVLPEMQIIKKVFNKFEAHIIVDNHEFTTYRSNLKHLGKESYAVSYDALYASARNLNLDINIRNLANNIVIEQMKKDLDNNNLTHAVYGTFKKSKNKIIGLEGGMVARIGRNAAGLTNAISILLETRGVAIGSQNFKRRVFSQLVMNESILNTANKNKDLIVSTINTSIINLIENGKRGNKDIIIQSKRKVGKKDYDFIDVAEDKIIRENIEYHYSSKAIITLSRKRPKFYVIPPAFSYVSKKIQNLGLELTVLDNEKTMKVEAFNIISNKVSQKIYEGEFRNTLKVKLVKRTLTFPKGTVLVSMAQKNANLLMLALEPDSKDSYATFNIIPVVKGDQYPIFRLH